MSDSIGTNLANIEVLEGTNSSNASDAELNISQISAFLSISTEDVQKLDHNVISCISKKLNSIEELKSENMILNAKLSQAGVESSKAVDKLEKKNQDLVLHTKKLQEDIKTMNDANEQYYKKVCGLNDQINDLTTEKSKLASIVHSLKFDLQSLQKLSAEYTTLKTDCDSKDSKIETLRGQILTAQKSIENLENEKNKLSVTNDDLCYKIQLVERTLDSYKNELENKRKQLDETSISKDNKINLVESDSAAVKQENVFLKEQLRSVNESKNDLSKRIEKLIIENNLISNDLRVKEEKFANELDLKDKKLKLSEESEKFTNERLNQVTDESNSKIEFLSSKISLFEKESKEKSNLVLQKESKIKELENNLDDLIASNNLIESNGASSNLSNGTSVSLSLVPTAKNLASNIKGFSLSELYSEYSLLRKQLVHEKRLKEMMQSQIDTFVSELEQKIPLIEIINSKNKILEDELRSLSNVLDSETSEKRQLNKKLEISIQEKHESELTVFSLLKSKIDLSKQIQQLLFQLKILNDINSEPLTDYERRELQKMLDSYKVSDKYIEDIQNEIHQRSNNTIVDTDSDKIISENLVTFNSIQELQTKNAELLKVTRSLIAKLELDEKSKLTALQVTENKAVTEYKDTIEKMLSEMQALELRLSSAEREKEMYKNLSDGSYRDRLLLSDKPSNESSPEIIHLNEEKKRLEKEVSFLEKNLNTVKVETKNIISDLSNKLDNVNGEKYNLLVEIASLKSTEMIQNERIKSSNEKLQFREEELKRIQSINEQLSGLLNKQEQEISNISVEFKSLNEQNENLKQQVSNLQTEISMTLSIKDRIIKENEELKENKGTLNKIVENLQSSNISREAEYNVNSKRLVHMIEIYDKDLKANREKINSLENSISDLNEKHIIELKQNISDMENIKTELSKTKEELLRKVASEEIFVNKCNMLEKQLSSSNAYIDSLTKATKDGGAESSETDKLKEQIKLLVNKLANAEEDLKNAIDDNNKFKEVSYAAETSLANMNQSYDDFKNKLEERSKELESEMNRIKLDVASLTEQKTNLEKQLNEKVEENDELNSKIGILSSKVATTEQVEAKFNDKAMEIQKSLMKAEEEVNAMRANYENEVKLHAESIVINKELEIEIKKVHEKYESLSIEFNSVKERLESANSKFDAERGLFKEQIDNLKTELDTRIENERILRRQLEILNNAKSNIESHLTGTGNAENLSINLDKNANTEDLIRLNGVIGRERDLLKAKLEISEQESAALYIKLSKTEDRLSKVEAEFKQLQISTKDLDERKNDNSRLLARMEDLQIIRESNSVLRSELTTKNNQLSMLELKITDLDKEKEPLKHQLNTLSNEITLKQQEIQLLKLENKDWEKKLQTILTTFDKIDPNQYQKLQDDNSKLNEDLKNVQTEVATLRQQHANDIKSKESLKNKFNEALKNKNAELADLSKKLDEAKLKSDELSSKINKLEEEKSELQKKVVQASNSKSTNNKKTATLTNKITEQTTMIAQLNVKINDLNTEIDSLKKSNHALNEENVAFDQEINDLSTEKEQMIKEHQDAIAALNSQIDKNKKQIDELSNSANNSRSSIIMGSSENLSVDLSKLEELKSEFEQKLSEIKTGFEEEKAKLAEELTKGKLEEIKKLNEELERCRSELAKMANITGKVTENVDIDALKKKWEEEQEPKILERITDAENNLRNKFEMPVREAINKRADFKFENYKKKYEGELKQAVENQMKAEFDKNIKDMEKTHDEKLTKLVNEYEQKLKTSVEEALKSKNADDDNKKQADPEDLKKLREFMDNQKKNEIDDLTKKHQAELTNKFNQGQKTGQLKVKILEGKIKKLEEKLGEAGVGASANSSPIKPTTGQVNKAEASAPTLSETVPVLPKIPVTADKTDKTDSDTGAENIAKKRSLEPASDAVETEEKKAKIE